MAKWIIDAKLDDETLKEVIFVLDGIDQYEIRAEVIDRIARLGFTGHELTEAKYQEFNEDGTLQSSGDLTKREGR
jgi:hypothetical protein